LLNCLGLSKTRLNDLLIVYWLICAGLIELCDRNLEGRKGREELQGKRSRKSRWEMSEAKTLVPEPYRCV